MEESGVLDEATLSPDIENRILVMKAGFKLISACFDQMLLNC